MTPKTPSSRDELPEPLRSIIEDIVSDPVPEGLIPSEPAFRAQALQTSAISSRPLSAVLVSLLALGICLMALVFQKPPAEPRHRITEGPEPAPPEKVQELPPPSLWAYRRAAQSPEGLDELLSQHAAVLLPPGEAVSFDPFSRKDEF
jgi:hypothetical protein